MIEALIFFLIYGLVLEILPLIPEFLYGLVVEILIPLFKFLAQATASILKLAGRFSWALMVFLYYLADEALRSEAGTEETELDEKDAYKKALQLLGLHNDCTQEELIRAFRSAMALAHPDKGGTDEQATAFNAARNIVKTHKGWR
jgi:hypothetical protein